MSSIVNWGLINVRRKPENPESDSRGQESWQEEQVMGMRVGEDRRERGECANLAEWAVHVNNSRFKKMHY